MGAWTASGGMQETVTRVREERRKKNNRERVGTLKRGQLRT